MGDTIRPFDYLQEEEREMWNPFRKALSKEDQEVFDRLYDRAKNHTHASVYMAHPYPLEMVLLSIFLEQEKMLSNIMSRLKEREGSDYPG